MILRHGSARPAAGIPEHCRERRPYDTDFGTAASALAAEIRQDLTGEAPSFPIVLDLSLRIKQVADDPHTTLDQLAALVRIEPLLAARVLRMANSIAFNPWGREVCDTPAAVRRIGLNNLRTLALTLAIEQLSGELGTAALRALAEESWRHSLDVAAWAYAIAHDLRLGSPDSALFCGLVANIGELLLIARAGKYPALCEDWRRFANIVDLWAQPMTTQLIALLGVPAEVAAALPERAPYDGQWPPSNLREILHVASLAADSDNPFDVLRGEVRTSIMDIAKSGFDAMRFDQLLASAELERDHMLAVLRP